MNIKIELNNNIMSEASDSYGAGGAFPTRDENWVAEEIKLAIACMISPESEDGDNALAMAGKIHVNVETTGSWPEVTSWTGTVTSIRGTGRFNLTVSTQ